MCFVWVFSNVCCDSICRWRPCSQSLPAETTQVCVLSSNLFPMQTWAAEFKVSWGKSQLIICFAHSRIFQVFNASQSCFSSIQTACWEVLCIFLQWIWKTINCSPSPVTVTLWYYTNTFSFWTQTFSMEVSAKINQLVLWF